MSKKWLITGCSSGFGTIVAEGALARGDRVVATAPKVGINQHLVERYPNTAAVIPLDETREGDAVRAVAKGEEAFGNVGILVNNVGFGL